MEKKKKKPKPVFKTYFSQWEVPWKGWGDGSVGKCCSTACEDEFGSLALMLTPRYSGVHL